MKRITVSATFPELIAHKSFIRAAAEANKIPVGIVRCLRQIWRNPNVKGHRITTIKLTVSVSKIEELKSEGNHENS